MDAKYDQMFSTTIFEFVWNGANFVEEVLRGRTTTLRHSRLYKQILDRIDVLESRGSQVQFWDAPSSTRRHMEALKFAFAALDEEKSRLSKEAENSLPDLMNGNPL
ncbi:hypothetical protein B0O99DRAFT_90492 [Bisporella sp. PMI_857]|nr:hypothetical protein B0O99DRAFT_90492 [Bisporella sp. PMI_857]